MSGWLPVSEYVTAVLGFVLAPIVVADGMTAWSGWNPAAIEELTEAFKTSSAAMQEVHHGFDQRAARGNQRQGSDRGEGACHP